MTSLTRPLRTKYALGALAGISLVGTLAGCSATDTADATSDSSASATTDDTTTSGTDATYTDGTYTAEGSYSSPAGTESISVELTLADGVVTAVTVTPEADDAQAKRYQTEFADGISAEAVGEDISTLTVSRVAGSSLTSGGFNDAGEAIKADAEG